MSISHAIISYHIKNSHAHYKYRFPNTLDQTNINNDSDTLKRLQNPVYDEMPATREEGEGPGPTYEIIPMTSHSSDGRRKPNGATSTMPTGQLSIITFI